MTRSLLSLPSIPPLHGSPLSRVWWAARGKALIVHGYTFHRHALQLCWSRGPALALRVAVHHLDLYKPFFWAEANEIGWLKWTLYWKDTCIWLLNDPFITMNIRNYDVIFICKKKSITNQWTLKNTWHLPYRPTFYIEGGRRHTVSSYQTLSGRITYRRNRRPGIQLVWWGSLSSALLYPQKVLMNCLKRMRCEKHIFALRLPKVIQFIGHYLHFPQKLAVEKFTCIINLLCQSFLNG